MVERSTSVTHRLVLIVSPLLPFQYVAVDVGDHGVGVHYELGLRVKVGNAHTEMKKLTLKTWRILFRSNFQVAIVCLSSFACASRDSGLRPPFSAMFSWIPATVLRSRAWWRGVFNILCATITNHWLNSRRQLFNRFVHGLTELIRSSSVHPSLECFTNVRAGQAELDVVQFIEH